MVLGTAGYVLFRLEVIIVNAVAQVLDSWVIVLCASRIALFDKAQIGPVILNGPVHLALVVFLPKPPFVTMLCCG